MKHHARVHKRLGNVDVKNLMNIEECFTKDSPGFEGYVKEHTKESSKKIEFKEDLD